MNEHLDLDERRARRQHRTVRAILLGLLIGIIGMLSAPAAGAAPADLPNLPADLEKYVPSSQQWAQAPWMTTLPCKDRGGDFSLWANSVIADTPSLLAYFQPSTFGATTKPENKPRGDAMLAGYQELSSQVGTILPAGYCVDDLRRWTVADVSMKPFGFPWGVTDNTGHQTVFSCRADAADKNTRPEMEYNHYFGADRAPCDGFYINCTNAPEAEKARCEAWNTFSDEYVRRVEKMRYKAISEHPAQTQGKTETKLKSPGEVVGDVVGGWFTDLTKSIATGSGLLLGEAMSFWTRTDRSEMLQDPAITEIQSLLKYVGIVLLTGSMIWQGIVMMYKKKLDPLVSTGLGLLSFVGWSSLGGTVAVLLNEAGIALAGQVLDNSINTFAKTVGDSLLGQVGAATGSTFFLSIILFFLSCIQWVLGFFRQGALVILLALLPTAAAGQLNESTKPWLKKVLSWCLSLILYQPIAAIIFAIGLQLIGGQDLSSVLVGMAVIALAIISMPTMLRFFDWGGQKLTTGGGGGGGAMALGAAGSALGGASGLSKFMDKSGPASQGNDSSGAVPVAPAHQGDGPGGPSESGPDQEGGGQSPGGGPSTGEQGGTGMPEPGGSGGDPTSAATGAVGAEAGTGAAASGSAGTAAGAGGGGAMAAAGPAGAAVAGAQVAKEGADQAVGAVTGAMTDGAGESS